MLVVLSCAALVAAGLAMVVRWTPLTVPAGAAPVPRQVAAALGAGFVAGVLAAGAGGRLVMRLLAATSDDSFGQLTEAEATVGRITVEGTIGFILFAGIPFGVLSGVLYLAVGRVLPGRWARGALFGLLLLVLGATRLDPLRADNFDFNLLGPPWLAVGAFVVLILFHGMLVAALDRRFARAEPPASGRTLTAGRVVVAVAALLALPGFVTAVADLL